MSTESLRQAIEDAEAADKAEASQLAEKQAAEKEALAGVPRKEGDRQPPIECE